MAQGYDGDIKLSVSLSADDVKSSAQSLSNDIKAIFSKSAGKELDSKFQRLQSAMSKAVTKSQELQSAMERLEKTEVPTDEYKEIQTQIDKARDSLVKLLDRQQKFIETGGDTKSKAYLSMQYDVDQLRNTISYAEGELQELVDTGKAFKLGSDTVEYENLKNQLGEVNNQMRVLTTSAEQYSQKADKAENSTKKLGSSMKSSSGSSSKFANGLGKAIGKFAMFAIGIRSVYQGFQKIKQAVTEGLTSMAMMNGGMNSANRSISQLMSSLNYLKGALASAFLPILNVVSPILSSLIDQIAQVITAIGMMIARLTGATSFTKVVKKNTNYAASQGGGGGQSAQEKYDEKVKKAQEAYDKKVASTEAKNAERMAKAEEKQAKAAAKLSKEQEKANGKLAAFDDLNVLGVETLEDMEDAEADLLEMPEFEMPEMDMSGGGGANDPFGLEEQALDSMENAFLDWLKEMIDAFVDGFDSAWDRLDLTNRIAKLKDYFQQIKDAFKEIFTDPAVVDAANNMLLAFMHMLGALTADFISIGVSIATFVVGGIAQYLQEEGTIQRIKDYLIEMFDIGTDIFVNLEKLGNAIANIFTALESPEALGFSETFVGIFSEAFMNVTELAGKFVRDVLDAITKPIIENQEKIKEALENMFGQLDTGLSGIRTTLDEFGQRLNQFYDEYVGPLIESIGTGLSALVELALDLYNNYVSPFMEILATAVSDLWTNHIGPLLDSIIEFLEPVIKLLQLLWENILVPFFGYLELACATLWNVLTVLFDFIIAGIEVIIDIIKGIIDVLTIVLDFIVDGFTVGWGEAWDNMKEKFDGWIGDISKFLTVDYWKGLAGNVIDGLKKGLEEGWNNFKDNAGAIGKKLISKFKEDTDVGSPSKKAEEVGKFIVEGLFLPFNDDIVAQNVTPFANAILNILRQNLTGASISDIGVILINSLIEGLTLQLPVLEEYILATFISISTLLTEQFTMMLETVFVPTMEMYNAWFDEQMQTWWTEHVLIWFANEKWQAEIYTPFYTFLQTKWKNLITWWDKVIKEWFKDLSEVRWKKLMKWWDESMNTWWNEQVVPWFEEERWREQFLRVYNVAEEVGKKTRDKIKELAEETEDAVHEACDAMIGWIEEVIAKLKEAIALAQQLAAMEGGGGGGGSSSSSGGSRGGSIGGSGGPRSFMPMLNVMHFEDNLGMSAFKFPELATGAVIPPNNEFLAVLGDQHSGTNIETPLSTMLEAFRSVMDEYMGGSHQSATMEVDGETFARLMMPHIMDEMHRLGYNTEIIEGI